MRIPCGGRFEVLVVEVMHGFIYHCFDGSNDLDLHPCCTMNLPEHDDGTTTNLQEQESGIL
jgi:hypothetical protein